jgi:hypothetical protein
MRTAAEAHALAANFSENASRRNRLPGANLMSGRKLNMRVDRVN